VTETKAAGTARIFQRRPFAPAHDRVRVSFRHRRGIGFLTQRASSFACERPDRPRDRADGVDVPVRAASAGTSGNVPAGAIRVVPPDQNPAKIRVRNKAATTGGTHTEAPVVAQKDIDKATVSLTKQLNDQLTAAIADPSQVLPGATVFPDTRSMSKPVPTPDPSTLVGQQVASFSYGLAATGSVTAVDTTEIEKLAEQRLRGSVSAGHDLVSGSLQVTVGKGKVAELQEQVQAADADVVIFDNDLSPATVRARRIEAERSSPNTAS
jgi:hypothetical protein